MSEAPRIALISATPTAIAPAAVAFAEQFPEASLWNILDDRLVTEVDAAGRLTRPLRRRMVRLIEHAVDGDADGVLLTCSMYGPAARTATQLWSVPMATSDEAMFDAVAESGARRVAVLGSLDSAVQDSIRRLTLHLTDRDVSPLPETAAVVIPGAVEAAREGRTADLATLVADAARVAEADADIVVLAQYSLCAAASEAGEGLDVPVLSAPHLAAAAFREQLAVVS